MSIAKLTSIRTVIRITCETNGKLTALTTVQWLQHGRNVREFTLLVPGWTVRVRCKQNPNQKKKHVTHHSSQNLLDPRNPRGPIQTCNIWTVDVTTPWRPPQWASWVCRTYSVCVGLVPGWESLKIRWLNYHLCHCPHWSLIYAHCGRKSMSPLSNTPTCIWICTDFFPTHPVFFLNK